jgi:hypothetical protein
MIYSKICEELLARGRDKSDMAKRNDSETLDSIRTWLVRSRTGSQANPTLATRKYENQAYKRYSDGTSCTNLSLLARMEFRVGWNLLPERALFSDQTCEMKKC